MLSARSGTAKTKSGSGLTFSKSSLLNVAIVLCSLFFSIAPEFSTAQTGPPVGPTVTTDIRFAPISDCQMVAAPNQSGIPTQMSAAVTATFNPSVLAGRVTSYTWSGLYFPPKTNTNAPTVTGYFTAPGVEKVTCHITYYQGGITEGSADYSSKPVYVVGGPLSLGISGGNSFTPSHDSVSQSTVPDDIPWYIQYFGFDPASTPNSQQQSPQTGTVAAFQGQPSGTTYKWTTDSNLKILNRVMNGNVSTITVGALAGTKGNLVACHLTYNFDNGDKADPVTGSCSDNCAQQLDQDGKPIQHSFTFDVHKPTSLMEITVYTPPAKVHNGPPNFTDWGIEMDYIYRLIDDANLPMPGVSVVERWLQPFGNESGYKWPIGSDSFTDQFYWYVPNAYPQTGPAIQTQEHRYYAATFDTNYFGLLPPPNTGINVYTTTTSWWTDFIQN